MSTVGVWFQSVVAALAGFGALLGIIDFSTARTDDRLNGGSAALDEDDRDADDAEENRQFEFSGRHLLASYSGCNSAAIRDINGLLTAFRAAVDASGATLLQLVDHRFPPDGMTAVAVLSESHASLHTYPEHESCFVDIFTCGDRCNVESFDVVMQRFLQPATHSHRVIRRHEEMVDESTVGSAKPR